MKKSLFTPLVALLLGASSLVQAQEDNKSWTLQTGFAYGYSSNSGSAFSTALYAGKRLSEVLELGVSLDLTLRQGKLYDHTITHVNDIPNNPLGSLTTNSWFNRYTRGSSISYAGIVGFSPTKLIWKNTRHDLVVGLQMGALHQQYHHLNINNEGNPQAHVWTGTNTYLMYGPRIAYEYRISNTLGAGLVYFHDFNDRGSSAHLTFNVHL